jgi:subtilisin-like proprotein convertase family protein
MIYKFARGCVALFLASVSLSGDVISPNPTIIDAAPAFDSNFVASKLFDIGTDEYASQGLAEETFVDFDFGTAKTIDRFVLVTRRNTVDVVGNSRLIFSADSTFGAGDVSYDFGPMGSNGDGFLMAFSSTTARYVRWQVLSSGGTSFNLGGTELRFLKTPAGRTSLSATVIASATAFNADYAKENAMDGDAGVGPGREYASQGQGLNTFIDFDFGAERAITGIDFFDRISAVDRTTSFNLIFSNDPTFATTISTVSVTPGANWGYSQNFAVVTARYVRWDATAKPTSSLNNLGMSEIIFYGDAPRITPISAKETSYFNPFRTALNLVNGSGISGSGHNTDINDMWYAGTNTGVLGGPTGNPPVVNQQVVEFDLGDHYNLNELLIWNYNELNQTGRGVKDFQLWISDSATGAFTQSGGTLTLNQASGTSGQAAQSLAVSANNVRRLQFRIQSAWSGAANEYVGLSEVRLVGQRAIYPQKILVQDPAARTLVDGSSTVFLGAVTVGNSISRTLTIKNIGQTTLSSISATLTGPDAGLFTLTALPETSLAGAGDSTALTVQFAPPPATSAGVKTAQLHITSSDPSQSPFDITLTGTQLAPGYFSTSAFLRAEVPDRPAGAVVSNPGVTFPITVSGLNPTQVIDNFSFTIAFDPTHLKAGDLTVTLTSPGGVTHTIFERIGQVTAPSLFNPNPPSTSADFAGPYTFTDVAQGNIWTTAAATNASAPIPVGAYFTSARLTGAQTAFTTTFSGLTGANANGVWQVLVKDGGSGNVGSVSSLELGLASYAGSPEIALEQSPGTTLGSGAEVSFASTTGVIEVDRTFTIRNTGLAPLFSVGVAIDGADASEFSVLTPPPTALAPGASATFTVRFKPASSGVKTAALHLASNDADENPIDLILSGLPIPGLAFSSTPLPASFPDGAVLFREIELPVSGVNGAINQIALSLAFGPVHTSAGDVIAELESPDGVRHTLFHRVGRVTTGNGSSSDLGGIYTFTDATTGNFWATDPLLSTSSFPAGTYRTSGADSGDATSILYTFRNLNATQANGTWKLILRDVDTNLQTGSVSFARLLIGTGNISYASWRDSRFSATELADTAISGPLADPNSDGVSNLLAYAFGIDPTGSSTLVALPQATRVTDMGTDYLELTFRRPAYLPANSTAAGGVSLSYEISTTLNSWTAVTATETILSTDASGSVIKARLPLPPGTARAFGRISTILQ